MKLLRVIASQLGGRVRKCENYDSHVCDFAVDASNYGQPVAVKGFPFSEQLRVSREGRKVELAENPEYLRLTVKGSLPVYGVCSINKPGLVAREKSRLRIGRESSWPVYIPSRSKPSIQLQEFLHSHSVHDAIRDLLANGVESVHVFDGGITLYSQPSNPDQVLSYLNVLLRLVHDQDANILDLAALPVEFQQLAPLIRKWAEPDDAERSALIDESSKDALSDLVRAVAPKFNQIGQYLDSLAGRPMPEDATALGTLAEAASEAQIKLRDK